MNKSAMMKGVKHSSFAMGVGKTLEVTGTQLKALHVMLMITGKVEESEKISEKQSELSNKLIEAMDKMEEISEIMYDLLPEEAKEEADMDGLKEAMDNLKTKLYKAETEIV